MPNYAFIFSAENRVQRDKFDSNNSSPFEKMAITLSHSIRRHSDADIYCGCFTENTLSAFARRWLHKLNVKVVQDIKFPKGFVSLRNYTKSYFSNLLDQYQYLIYIDIDAVVIAKPQFRFDPTSEFVLTCTVPQWGINYHKQYLDGLQGPLYYNWVDIINRHNAHIFDLNWDDIQLNQHNADVIISNRIADSSLNKIEMDFGGYHHITHLRPDSIFHHYDNVGEDGCLYNLQTTHPEELNDIVSFFKTEMKINPSTRTDYWEVNSKQYEY